jgi:hypothetical protein
MQNDDEDLQEWVEGCQYVIRHTTKGSIKPYVPRKTVLKKNIMFLSNDDRLQNRRHHLMVC